MEKNPVATTGCATSTPGGIKKELVFLHSSTSHWVFTPIFISKDVSINFSPFLNLPARSESTFMRVDKNPERKEDISCGSKHPPSALPWSALAVDLGPHWPLWGSPPACSVPDSSTQLVDKATSTCGLSLQWELGLPQVSHLISYKILLVSFPPCKHLIIRALTVQFSSAWLVVRNSVDIYSLSLHVWHSTLYPTVYTI